MELCLKFDDSDFELKNKVSSTIDVPYNAKMCTPFVSIYFTFLLVFYDA